MGARPVENLAPAQFRTKKRRNVGEAAARPSVPGSKSGDDLRGDLDEGGGGGGDQERGGGEEASPGEGGNLAGHVGVSGWRS